MICSKHRAIALTDDDHGWPLCSRCFEEAKQKADDDALEARIMALRLPDYAVTALLKRLGWL